MSKKKEAYAKTAAESEQRVASAGGRVPAAARANARPDEESREAGPSARRAPDQAVIPGILGRQLRAAYGELLNVPVPDRFNDLIKKLQEKESEDAATTVGDEEESA